MPNSALERLVAHDPVLARMVQTIPPPQVVSTNDVFFDLMSCVLEQQIHYRSSKKVFQKMLDRAGLTTLTPDNFHELEEKALPDARLSTSKFETIAAVLQAWQQPEPDWQTLSDEAVRAHLGAIKGIGPWTMDMILLYTLQRPNVFPHDDFHLKQIMVAQYGLDPNSRLKAQMLEVASAWGEQRSLAVLYLLAWKEFGKQAKGSTAKNS